MAGVVGKAVKQIADLKRQVEDLKRQRDNKRKLASKWRRWAKELEYVNRCHGRRIQNLHKALEQKDQKLYEGPIRCCVEGEENCRIVRKALWDGLGNARQCLEDHERDLGRTTRKNRIIAETYEQDIENMKQALEAFPSSPDEW